MRDYLLLAIVAVACLGVADARRARAPGGNKTEAAGANREGKVFTLFNVVQFQNEECRSNSRTNGAASGASHRNGTCYTASECRDKSGTASGSCAAGFGVCCVFIIDETGDDVNQNCTYIQNPNFPGSYDETSNVQHTINKCSDQVCSIRLDFESFTILGTADTTELDDVEDCDDTFAVTTSTGFNVPTICGRNTGQHMYIDIGRDDSDSIQLSFNFNGDSNVRSWEIKVTQIKCMDALLPPEGCLQYHLGTSGRLETFNFLSSDEIHPPIMNYNMCIRQEQGFCCIRYQVCDDDNAFTLDVQDLAAGIFQGNHDTMCTDDYVLIENSMAVLGQKFVHHRYCGNVLVNAAENDADAPIYSCSTPFMVGIRAVDGPDADHTGTTANLQLSRGVCLTFDQLPCNGAAN